MGKVVKVELTEDAIILLETYQDFIKKVLGPEYLINYECTFKSEISKVSLYIELNAAGGKYGGAFCSWEQSFESYCIDVPEALKVVMESFSDLLMFVAEYE